MVPKILNSLLIVLEVLLIFNLLIVVHELGHFLAARWRGLVIDEFGIWFGKPIWRKNLGGVWFSLGSIPAGGFVKLPQLAPMEAIEGETEEREAPLPPIKPLDKILVALAGPVFSFLLAVVMAGVVWAVGKPVHEFDQTTVIGFVKPGGPAERAGLLPGDRILEVDGKPVDRFTGPLHSVTWRVVRSEGETIAFKIEREGQTLTLNSGWEREEVPGWKRKSLRKVFIGQRLIPSVGRVAPGSVAAMAGIQAGDVITTVDGAASVDLGTFYESLEKAKGAPLHLTLQRAGAETAVTLSPGAPPEGAKSPDLGISWGRLTLTHPSPVEQVTDAVLTIRNMLDALFSPKSDVKAQHFSGPVGILKAYYSLFDSEQGWRLALAFSVFFNVNLALFNMLPFPVLDGGHITLAIIESLRRKPIGGRFLEGIQTACAIAVMVFLAYVTFFDVSDFLPGRKAATAPATPPPAAAGAIPAMDKEKAPGEAK
ncbi:MAG: regulator of sigma E protease [Verrucomicrobia bacterium]|nr:MAG: regulator of sigma E protease [Verrucomicrobiota bacterium]